MRLFGRLPFVKTSSPLWPLFTKLPKLPFVKTSCGIISSSSIKNLFTGLSLEKISSEAFLSSFAKLPLAKISVSSTYSPDDIVFKVKVAVVKTSKLHLQL